MTTNTKTKKTHEPIQDLEGEVWRDAVGFEGLYQVSNMGRVKSLNSTGHKNVHRIMTPSPNKNGYVQVHLTKDGNRFQRNIHRLVYEAFVGNLPDYNPYEKRGCEILEINHIDENKSNNCVWNLELVTHTENVNHGTSKERSRKKLINGKKSKKIYQYSINGDLIRIWESESECKRNGYENTLVSMCCTGRLLSHRGYIWSFNILQKEYLDYIIEKILNPNSDKRKEVYQYTNDGNLIRVWTSTAECGRNGFCPKAISACCIGKRKTHKGYIWSYKPIGTK